MDVRKVIRKLTGLIIILSFLGTIKPVYTATQGKAGQTSSGSFTIRLVIPARLEANPIAATSSENASGEPVISTARFNQKEPICIKGKGIDNYRLIAEGSGDEGSFTINSQRKTYNYDVNLWTSLKSSSQMTSGRPSEKIAPTPAYQDCNASDTRISVSLDTLPEEQSELNGTLNLTVSAE